MRSPGEQLPLPLAEGVWRAWPPETPAAPESLRGLEYLVVDVETTGGAAARGHRITEIAALRVAWDGRVLDEFRTLVNPERPIPRGVTALTNITEDMVRDAPRFHEIADAVQGLMVGRVFVAHNASYDWSFLDAELTRALLEVPECRILCTVRLARRVVPEVPGRSLDALMYFFGIENEARHRAFGDARATAEMLRRLLDRVDEREVTDWAGLETLLSKRAPRRKRRASPTSIEWI